MAGAIRHGRGGDVVRQVLWITWEVQRRNRTLSRRFGAELHEILAKGSRPARYFSCASRTIGLIRTRRPAVLIVQSPSVLLALIAVTFGPIWCGRVVIDAHNAGVFPLEGRRRLLNWVCRWILARSDVVLVSNEELQGRLGLPNVQVLPDPLPDLVDPVAIAARPCPDHSVRGERDDVFRATYVTSWAGDEPYMAVIKSAANLPPGFQIRITGRAPADVRTGMALPPAVQLLGYLDDAAYASELMSSDLIIVLTTRQSCLTCGAYEAVSLRKPLLLSRTKALKEYFGDAATYVDNSPDEIGRGILESSRRIADMRRNAERARDRVESSWERKYCIIKEIVLHQH